MDVGHTGRQQPGGNVQRPIQYNPVQGITYTANSAFGTAGTLLGGAGEYVVYNGTGTSATVTNLGANNLTYYVAVYEYSASAGPVYNTAAPATDAFPGPGVITGAKLLAFTNNIPINGAVPVRLVATFSTGDTSDQTANATWVSSDTTIASVNTAGVVSGVANGTATITGTFGSYSPTYKYYRAHPRLYRQLRRHTGLCRQWAARLGLGRPVFELRRRAWSQQGQ